MLVFNIRVSMRFGGGSCVTVSLLAFFIFPSHIYTFTATTVWLRYATLFAILILSGFATMLGKFSNLCYLWFLNSN